MSNQTSNTSLKKITKDNTEFRTQKDLKELNEQYRVKQSAYQDLKSQYLKDKSEFEKIVSDLKNEVSGQKSILKNLKKEIKENTERLKTQEEQIDMAVKTGNGHIMDLQYEAGNLEEIKGRLEYEIASMAQTKDTLLTDLQILNKQKTVTEDQYTKQNKLYQITLEELRNRIFSANNELKETQDKAKEIIVRLKEKELELSTN